MYSELVNAAFVVGKSSSFIFAALTVGLLLAAVVDANTYAAKSPQEDRYVPNVSCSSLCEGHSIVP